MLEAEKISISHDGSVVACSADLSEKNPEADVIVVQKFENIEEACVTLTVTNDETGEITKEGEQEVLDLINSAHRAASMNKIRAGYARPRSVFSALKEKVKDDASARAKFEALLAELDMGDLADL